MKYGKLLATSMIAAVFGIPTASAAVPQWREEPKEIKGLKGSLERGNQRGSDGGSVISSPQVLRALAGNASRTLSNGYRLAIRMVDRRRSCAALFEDFGQDGVKTLQSGLYLPASSSIGRRVCGPGARAFTTVRSRVVRICPAFASLKAHEAGIILIHEALHTAGMTERPSDPRALTSVQLTKLVERRCR